MYIIVLHNEKKCWYLLPVQIYKLADFVDVTNYLSLLVYAFNIQHVGMQIGDFIVGIGEDDVKWMKHDRVVMLIRSCRRVVTLCLVTPVDHNYIDPSRPPSIDMFRPPSQLFPSDLEAIPNMCCSSPSGTLELRHDSAQYASSSTAMASSAKGGMITVKKVKDKSSSLSWRFGRKRNQSKDTFSLMPCNNNGETSKLRNSWWLPRHDCIVNFSFHLKLLLN